MSDPSLLPELLELSVHLHSAFIQPGTTLPGTIHITIPTERSIALLNGEPQQSSDSSSGGIFQSSLITPKSTPSASSVTPNSSTNKNRAQQVGTLAEAVGLLSTQDTDGTNISHLTSSSLQPLSRPFAFELKLQVCGKVTCDGNKVSIASLERFRPIASPSNIYSFKMWSTRIVTIQVEANESATFPRAYEFRVPLPDSLLPSFRSSALSHSYYLQVVACVPGSPSKKLLDMKVPFRVRVGHQSHPDQHNGGPPPTTILETPSNLISTIQHCLVSPVPSRSISPAITTATLDSLGSSTPSLMGSASPEKSDSQPNLLLIPSSTSLAVGTILNHHNGHSSASQSRRNSVSSAVSPLSGFDSHPSTPLTFNISKTVLDAATNEEIGAHVVRLTLDQRYLRPGDTLRGHLDFSRAGIRCYRLSITLEQEERISEDCMKPGAKEPFNQCKSYALFHQYTVNTLSTHFLFSLPLDVVPNFHTDLTQATWRLNFKFITDIDIQPKHTWSFLPAPSTTHAEALLWTLPLTVLSPEDSDVSKQPVLKTLLFSPQSFV